MRNEMPRQTNETHLTESQHEIPNERDRQASGTITSERRHLPNADMFTIQTARTTARTLSIDLKGRQARLRRASVRRSNATSDVPPLIDIFSTRGGVEQELKLALLCNWIAGAVGGGYGQTAAVRPAPDTPLLGPHSADVDEIQLCELLTLACSTGPERAASFRKLKRYFDRLRIAGLVKVSDDYTRFALCADDGSGREYTDPGSKDRDRDPQRDAFFRVPGEFFKNGWLSLLSGPAVMTFLILLEMAEYPTGASKRSGRHDGLWVNQTLLAENYPISKSSLDRGVAQLRDLRLVQVSTEFVSRVPRRSRSRYRLILDRLADDAADPLNFS